jgi:TrmH family RNA methyltransferase
MNNLPSKLKLVRNLLEKPSARRKEKCFVVEGPHLVEEAQERIKFIVYSENLPVIKKLEAKSVPAYKVSRQQFAELSGVETPQGILGVVKEFAYQLRDVLTPSVPRLRSGHLPLNKGEIREGVVIVFCVGVQDPGNLGTIIRSADAFGASGVVLSKGTVDLYNPKVVRSTMGSLFHLPIITINEARETIEHLKQKGVKIIATGASAELDCFAADLKTPLAILVGNEGGGLPEEVMRMADAQVKIPMPGSAESLNVGVSTAVILYETLRQWKTK